MRPKTVFLILAAMAAVDLVQRRKKVPPIFVVDRVPGGFNALTLPPFGIFIRSDQKDNANLMGHELMHWDQYRRKGMLSFHVDYLKDYIRYGYDHHPMEIEARFIESPEVKTNYTAAVRNCTAVTACNPNFRNP